MHGKTSVAASLPPVTGVMVSRMETLYRKVGVDVGGNNKAMGGQALEPQKSLMPPKSVIINSKESVKDDSSTKKAMKKEKMKKKEKKKD